MRVGGLRSGFFTEESRTRSTTAYNSFVLQRAVVLRFSVVRLCAMTTLSATLSGTGIYLILALSCCALSSHLCGVANLF